MQGPATACLNISFLKYHDNMDLYGRAFRGITPKYFSMKALFVRFAGNGFTLESPVVIPHRIDTGRRQVFGLIGVPIDVVNRFPTGHRFPLLARAVLHDGCRSYRPLRVSSGFQPDSLLRCPTMGQTDGETQHIVLQAKRQYKIL